MPLDLANASAPRPAIMTCDDFSMTARASRIGLRTVRTPATAPALQRGTVHDCGIEFVVSFVGEHGTFAGIEVRIVLEHGDGRRYGIERGLSGIEFGVAGADRLEQGRAHFGLEFGRHAGANDAGAAVDDERRLVRATSARARPARAGARWRGWNGSIDSW